MKRLSTSLGRLQRLRATPAAREAAALDQTLINGVPARSELHRTYEARACGR